MKVRWGGGLAQGLGVGGGGGVNAYCACTPAGVGVQWPSATRLPCLVQPMPSHCLPDAKCQFQWHL